MITDERPGLPREASKLLDVPGPEPIRRALMVAVAELHVEAGWSGFDGGLYDRAMLHYARSLELATEAGDAYLQALVLVYAGVATVEHGRCLLYTSPSPRDRTRSRMPSSA